MVNVLTTLSITSNMVLVYFLGFHMLYHISHFIKQHPLSYSRCSLITNINFTAFITRTMDQNEKMPAYCAWAPAGKSHIANIHNSHMM